MFPRKNKSINRWAAVLAMVFTLLFLVLLGRFVYLAEAKAVEGHDLINIGKKTWTHVKMIDAERGKIIGSDGEIFAHDTPAYTIYAVLSKDAAPHVVDKEKTAAELAPLLNMSADQILTILNKERFQVEFGSHGYDLSIETMQKIKNLKLPGIGFFENSIRYYPNGSFASYVVGFTNHYKKDKDVGTVGIEQSLNDYLTEQDGEISFYSDRDGVIMPDGNQKVKKPHNGDDVYLTINGRIQTVLEDAMDKVNKEYKPERMIGIVADPKTGAILAMSNRPTFNPNLRNIKDWTNDAISDPYEPGSVMKTFTLAAAINEHVWPGNQTYVSGKYPIKSKGRTVAIVHDWRSNWGTITFNQGFTRSSNVAFSIVEDKYLGPDRFHNYLERFGFTKKTGIDLPNESNSRVNFKWKTDQVMSSFGQATAVTPIQIIQAATAIANDGKMMQPYVIQKIVNPDTKQVVKEHQRKQVGQPISKETATKVRQMMHDVVWDNDNGTGNNYQIPNYDIIGKTGTAQLYGTDGKLLRGEDNYIFSFLGMAPEKDPKLIVYVAIDRPHLMGKEGSIPVSEVFKPVMKNAMQYMNVAPKVGSSSEAAQPKTITIKNWVGNSMSSAKAALEDKGLTVVTIGSGTVKGQSLYDGLQVLPGTKIILVGNGLHTLPDVRGWTLTEVLQLDQVLGLKPNIKGNGFVVSQNPAIGSAVKQGMTFSVTLQSMESSAPTKDKKDK